MATIPEIEERIHALWDKGDVRTLDESVELGRLLTALQTEMPPGDFYTHVLDVLHIPARAAQRFMQQYREYQGAGRRPSPTHNRPRRCHAHRCTPLVASLIGVTAVLTIALRSSHRAHSAERAMHPVNDAIIRLRRIRGKRNSRSVSRV